MECEWSIKFKKDKMKVTSGFAYNVETEDSKYKGVATRTELSDVNKYYVGNSYKVYAAFAIKDKDTGEVLEKGGPVVKDFTLLAEDAFAAVGLAVASASLLAATIF